MKNFFIIIFLTLWPPLLQAGVCYKSPESKLFKAIKSNKTLKLQQLLNTEIDQIGINSIWNKKGTALTFAIKREKVDIVKILLENGADPNQIDGENTPLEIAVSKCNEKIVQLLIDKGVNINLISVLSRTRKEHISDYAQNHCINKTFKYLADSLNQIDFDGDLDLLELRIGSSKSLRITMIDHPAIKTPSDILNLFSDRPRGKFRFSVDNINKFFNLSPAPTIQQVLTFASLSVKPLAIVNEAYNKDLVQSPQDFIDLFSNSGPITFFDSAIDHFFNLSPAPTIQQVLAFASLSVKPLAIVNEAYNKDLVQSPQDFIDLFSNSAPVDFFDSAIDHFFNLSPAPTIQQVIAFANLSKKPFKILNEAYNKGFIQSPQDFIDLFSNSAPVDFFDSAIDDFFNFSPAPTIQQVIAFANLSLKPLAIVNEAYSKDLVQSPQDFIDLFSNSGPINFFNSTIDRFISSYPPPNIKQIQSFLKIIHSKKQKNRLKRAIPILLTQAEEDFIPSLKDQVRAKIERLEGKSPEDRVIDSKEQFFQILQEDKLSAATMKRTLEGNPKDLKVCPICLEEKEKKDFNQCLTPSCIAGKERYAICTSCTKESLDLQFKEHSFPISCNNCGIELPLTEDYLDQLGLSNQKFPLQKGSILAYHNKLFPKAKNCATPDCINRIRKSDCNHENKHYECKFCAYSYCFKCEEEHKGRSCKGYKKEKKGDVAFQNLLHDPKSDIRPCPYCETPTEKSEACDHMKCSQCKHSWDWRLGKKPGKVYYSKNNGIEPRLYRIPGDKNMKTGVLYKRYQENVKNDF